MNNNPTADPRPLVRRWLDNGRPCTACRNATRPCPCYCGACHEPDSTQDHTPATLQTNLPTEEPTP